MSPRFLRFVPLLASLACSAPDPGASTTIPSQDPTLFPPLEAAMGPSCASLDCHGRPGRNLRIYDVGGLRLSANDVSGVGKTTPDELAADRQSLLGLEPAITDQVLREKGARPDRLMVVQKARGAVAHKGNSPWPEGSAGDRCLVSYFASQLDAPACQCAALGPTMNDPTCPPLPP